MSCVNECKLCKNLVISESVAFAGDVLTITLPTTSAYINGCKKCIVIAQAIPDETTINATVEISVGGVTYPLLNKCGGQVLASQLRTRRLYPTRVNTSGDGSFIVQIQLPCVGTVAPELLPTTPEAGA
jgi:hypothetical protein